MIAAKASLSVSSLSRVSLSSGVLSWSRSSRLNPAPGVQVYISIHPEKAAIHSEVRTNWRSSWHCAEQAEHEQFYSLWLGTGKNQRSRWRFWQGPRWGQSSGLSTLNELWHLLVENKIWIVLFQLFHLTNKILCTINFRNLIQCEYYQCYQTWIGWEYNPYSYFTPGIVSSIWVRNKLFFSNYFISPNKILGTINGKNVSTVNTLHAFML